MYEVVTGNPLRNRLIAASPGYVIQQLIAARGGTRCQYATRKMSEKGAIKGNRKGTVSTYLGKCFGIHLDVRHYLWCPLVAT
jgi:hypothetical protein